MMISIILFSDLGWGERAEFNPTSAFYKLYAKLQYLPLRNRENKTYLLNCYEERVKNIIEEWMCVKA